MFASLFAYLQYLLPRYFITALVYRIARIRNVRVKNLLISGFVRLYRVDLGDVDARVPDDFATFNDFFVRDLAAGSRPVDPAADAIVSPVDGTVSAAARIDGNSLFQAKGLDYSLETLFAIDLDDARRFVDGRFVTIYLAPYNYHRVHMPVDGKLVAAHYVPGDLFSVNNATTSTVRGLFRRNERLILHFDTAFGPAALVFVGALNVGSISTPWTGELRPRKSGVVDNLQLGDAPRELARGDLLGWFNMGSTVIVLLPEGAGRWQDTLQSGTQVRMGERIGGLPTASQ